MSWFMTADSRRFLNGAGEFLRADPARNTVILTVTEDLRVKAASARALFGWWQPDGEPVGAAFMHTPDYPLLLSRVSVPAAARLAGDLTEARRRLRQDILDRALGKGRAGCRARRSPRPRAPIPPDLPRPGRHLERGWRRSRPRPPRTPH